MVLTDKFSNGVKYIILWVWTAVYHDFSIFGLLCCHYFKFKTERWVLHELFLESIQIYCYSILCVYPQTKSKMVICEIMTHENKYSISNTSMPQCRCAPKCVKVSIGQLCSIFFLCLVLNTPSLQQILALVLRLQQRKKDLNLH